MAESDAQDTSTGTMTSEDRCVAAAGPPRLEANEERRPGGMAADDLPPSVGKVVAIVVVALLLAGALVAHLLAGPGARPH